MDKRYLVFISSTYDDLREEREKVIQAILELNNFPVGMEHFPASGLPPQKLIHKMIMDCDYFVLIIGDRYGSLCDSGMSYTEEEYDFAVDLGIPVLAFIHEGKFNKNIDNYEKLIKFIDKVKHGKHTVKTWSTPDGLMSGVMSGLYHAIKDNPRLGWVRADAINITSKIVDDQIKERQTTKRLPEVVKAADGETAILNENEKDDSAFWNQELSVEIDIGINDEQMNYDIPYSIKRTLKDWFIPIAQSIYDSISYATLYSVENDLTSFFVKNPNYKKELKKYVYDYFIKSEKDSFDDEISRMLPPRPVLLPRIRGIRINERQFRHIIHILNKELLIEMDRNMELRLSEMGEEFFEKFVNQGY